jgi:hypothetical protein
MVEIQWVLKAKHKNFILRCYLSIMLINQMDSMGSEPLLQDSGKNETIMYIETY